MAGTVTRFAFTLEGEQKISAPMVVPLRGDPTSSTVGDLVRSLERRLDRKFSPNKAPSVRQLVLADGDALDPLINDDDALDCFWGGSETHHVTVRLFAPSAETQVKAQPATIPDSVKGAFLPTIAVAARPAASSAPPSPAPPSSSSSHSHTTFRSPSVYRCDYESSLSPAVDSAAPSTGSSGTAKRRWRELSGGRSAVAEQMPVPAARIGGSESGNHGHQGQSAAPPSPGVAVSPAGKRPSPVLCVREVSRGPEVREIPRPPDGSAARITGGCLSRRLPSRGGLRPTVTPISPGVRMPHVPLPPPPAVPKSEPPPHRRPFVVEEQQTARREPVQEAADTDPIAGHRMAEMLRWGDMLLKEHRFNEERERSHLMQEEWNVRASLQTKRDGFVCARTEKERKRKLELADVLRRQYTLQQKDEGSARSAVDDTELRERVRIHGLAAHSKASVYGCLSLQGCETMARSAVSLSETEERELRARQAAAEEVDVRDGVGRRERCEAELDEEAGREGVLRECVRERAEAMCAEAARRQRVAWNDAERQDVLDEEGAARCALSTVALVDGQALVGAGVEEGLRIRLRKEAKDAAETSALCGDESTHRSQLMHTELQKRQMYARLANEAYARATSGSVPTPSGWVVSPPRIECPALVGMRSPPQPAPAAIRSTTAPVCVTCTSPTESEATAHRPATTATGASSIECWDGTVVMGSWGFDSNGHPVSSRLRRSASRSSAVTDDFCGSTRKSVTFRSPLRQVFSPTPNNSVMEEGDCVGPAPPATDPID
eukprot:TRINITY_DN7386_c0_g1_i2.p1 TRINITY_DN7386_c0_g1~~TRINITY_DN7386_c0_g1_i2.p1  ORF type:complete len:841 (+),score=144.35 TRINITY_DN7386_c0_g1_i2:190-2523(+)